MWLEKGGISGLLNGIKEGGGACWECETILIIEEEEKLVSY